MLETRAAKNERKLFLIILMLFKKEYPDILGDQVGEKSVPNIKVTQ